MAKSDKELALKLAVDQRAMVPAKLNQELNYWWLANRKHFLGLIDAKTDDEKLTQASKIVSCLKHVVVKNPKILECTMESIGDCLLSSASLNLLPGVWKECAYAPFKIKGRYEAVFMPQYQGLSKLAFQSGFLKDINTEAVYPTDKFVFQKGTRNILQHYPDDNRSDDPNDITKVWCIITPTSGGKIIEVMSRKKIEDIMKKSPAYRYAEDVTKKKDSIWHLYWEDMARKTVFRKAIKPFPKSAKLNNALELDNIASDPETKANAIKVDDFDFDFINLKELPHNPNSEEKEEQQSQQKNDE